MEHVRRENSKKREQVGQSRSKLNAKPALKRVDLRVVEWRPTREGHGRWEMRRTGRTRQTLRNGQRRTCMNARCSRSSYTHYCTALASLAWHCTADASRQMNNAAPFFCSPLSCLPCKSPRSDPSAILRISEHVSNVPDSLGSLGPGLAMAGPHHRFPSS